MPHTDTVAKGCAELIALWREVSACDRLLREAQGELNEMAFLGVGLGAQARLSCPFHLDPHPYFSVRSPGPWSLLICGAAGPQLVPCPALVPLLHPRRACSSRPAAHPKMSPASSGSKRCNETPSTKVPARDSIHCHDFWNATHANAPFRSRDPRVSGVLPSRPLLRRRVPSSLRDSMPTEQSTSVR